MRWRAGSFGFLWSVVLRGIEDAAGIYDHFASRRDGAEKTGTVAFMADAGADGFDLDEQGVGVAIDAKFTNFQDVAAGLAFFPELVARTAEEDGLAGRARLRQGGFVHEAEHEDSARLVILDNRGNESSGFLKIDVQLVHLPTP